MNPVQVKCQQNANPSCSHILNKCYKKLKSFFHPPATPRLSPQAPRFILRVMAIKTGTKTVLQKYIMSDVANLWHVCHKWYEQPLCVHHMAIQGGNKQHSDQQGRKEKAASSRLSGEQRTGKSKAYWKGEGNQSRCRKKIFIIYIRYILLL